MVLNQILYFNLIWVCMMCNPNKTTTSRSGWIFLIKNVLTKSLDLLLSSLRSFSRESHVTRCCVTSTSCKEDTTKYKNTIMIYMYSNVMYKYFQIQQYVTWSKGMSRRSQILFKRYWPQNSSNSFVLYCFQHWRIAHKSETNIHFSLDHITYDINAFQLCNCQTCYQ